MRAPHNKANLVIIQLCPLSKRPEEPTDEDHMPTYEYSCRKCSEVFQVQQSFSDTPLKKHEGCGGALSKVFGAVGIVLKGSGFYKTDNPSSQRSSTAKSDAKSESSSDSGSKSGESKSGDKKSSESKSSDSKAAPAKSDKSSTTKSPTTRT